MQHFIKQQQRKSQTGFTLLELLIVIAIISILSVALIIVLNPVETLKKARDVQRISDLNTLKNAIGIYTTTISSPTLGSTDDTNAGVARTNFSNTACQTTTGTFVAGEDRIWYSFPGITGTGDITDDTIAGVTFTPAGFGATQVSSALQPLVDGTGWLPIKFSTIAGGSPISNLPVDPINSVSTGTSTAAAMTADAQVYRYACEGTNATYEINATLESNAFTVDDDKRAKDGGNSALMYELGTNLLILPINNATAASALGF